MTPIVFNQGKVAWINNSGTVITWTNVSTNIVGWTTVYVQGSIRTADFVRVTTQDALGNTVIYRFATTPNVMTIPAVDSQPFNALGSLVKINDVQRDIKSTANETAITLVGIDTALLGWVLSQKIKGSYIEMWHAFFDADYNLITQGGTGGLYKFFTGYINAYQISEQWIEEARMFVGVITVNASSIQIILQNRTAGRYTNDNAWQFFNAGDTSMNRVPIIQTINYSFGKS
jgi:hypothetical protein